MGLRFRDQYLTDDTDLTDDFQVGVASKGVVLDTAVHFLMPVPPLNIKLGQRLGPSRLRNDMAVLLHETGHDFTTLNEVLVDT